MHIWVTWQTYWRTDTANIDNNSLHFVHAIQSTKENARADNYRKIYTFSKIKQTSTTREVRPTLFVLVNEALCLQSTYHQARNHSKVSRVSVEAKDLDFRLYPPLFKTVVRPTLANWTELNLLLSIKAPSIRFTQLPGVVLLTEAFEARLGARVAQARGAVLTFCCGTRLRCNQCRHVQFIYGENWSEDFYWKFPLVKTSWN